jgi:hypothetical protein
MLFVSLNVVIRTISITYRIHQTSDTNRDLKRNPCLLYRLSTCNLSTDKAEEVIKFEKLGNRRENGKQYSSSRRKKKGENRKKKGNQK